MQILRCFFAFSITLALVFTAGLNGQAQAQSLLVTDPDSTEVYRIDLTTGDRELVQGILTGPAGIAVESTGDIIVTDFNVNRIFRLDPVTGVVSVASGPNKGTGPDLGTPISVLVERTGQLAVIDGIRIKRVNAINGNRTVISGPNIGDGPAFSSMRDIARDQDDNLFVVDNSLPAVFHVDPVTGDRTIISDASTGAGPALVNPRSIALGPLNQILVADSGLNAILWVDRTTGDRVIASDAGTGTGPAFVNPRSVFMRLNGQILVADNGLPAIVSVNSFNGNRSVISGFDPDIPGIVGAGPEIDSFFDITFEHSPPPPLTVHFQDAFAAPGGVAIVKVTLETNQDITGGQFRIQALPDSLVQFNDLIVDIEHLGFEATSATIGDSLTSVLLFSLVPDATIPTGTHMILELLYNINGNVPPLETIDLAITDVVFTDVNSEPIPPAVDPGIIQIGRPGDLSFDGHVNIVDIVKVIRYILYVMPPPTGFDLFLADVNGDGRLDISDLVKMINIFLNTPPPKVVADAPARPVTVGLGDLQTLSSGQTAIPVVLEADGSIAGLQASLTFDPGMLSIGEPQLVGRAAGLTLQAQITDGTLRMIAYSTDGQVIPAGTGATVLIPVTILNEAVVVTLADVILAGRQAQTIPVTIGTGTLKVSTVPTAFSLQTSAPNPFNPSTTIAYEVPASAHITLTVYNLLGQEVVRLVDEVRTPGRYRTVWHGTNAHGQAVASGVYLYRLTSSTGYNETKRMTLLK